MRYLTSISLALVVHVLLSIVVLMALACTATPTPTPTPAGPMYSEEEAIAVLKEHLQAKPVPIPGFPHTSRAFLMWGVTLPLGLPSTITKDTAGTSGQIRSLQVPQQLPHHQE